MPINHEKEFAYLLPWFPKAFKDTEKKHITQQYLDTDVVLLTLPNTAPERLDIRDGNTQQSLHFSAEALTPLREMLPLHEIAGHHYLPQQDWAYCARLRRTECAQGDIDYELTIKANTGDETVRLEYDISLTASQFASLSKLSSAPHCIEKTRYLLPADDNTGGVWELDVFHGALSPLLKLEREVKPESMAVPYPPADWLAEEITHDKRFTNARMAFQGLPEIFRGHTG